MCRFICFNIVFSLIVVDANLFFYMCSGDFCEIKACKDDCNKRGECVNGVCFCEIGLYTGAACEVPVCPNQCSSHGVCKKGVKIIDFHSIIGI